MAQRFLLTSHYIILGWQQVLTSVTPTHDYIKHRTEIKIAVGCLGFSLKILRKKALSMKSLPLMAQPSTEGTTVILSHHLRVVLKIF